MYVTDDMYVQVVCFRFQFCSFEYGTCIYTPVSLWFVEWNVQAYDFFSCLVSMLQNSNCSGYRIARHRS